MGILATRTMSSTIPRTNSWCLRSSPIGSNEANILRKYQADALPSQHKSGFLKQNKRVFKTAGWYTSMWRKVMLKPLVLCSVVASATLIGLNAAASTEFGVAEEAKAMLVRAIDELKANKLTAIEEFNRNDPRFRDRDLFVFCFNRGDGRFTAHEAFVGWDVRTLHDAAGKAFGEDMYRSAKEGQISEVAFRAPMPGSTEKVSKRAYVTAIGDQVCGVSSYRF
jgi:hypothetical protein